MTSADAGAHRAAPTPRAPRLRLRLADLRLFVRLTVLTAAGGLLAWGIAPYALGWHTTMITSGSMTPAIRQGDLVVIAPLDPETAATADLRGAVIQFEDPQRPGGLVLHRVMSRDAAGRLITKGDANGSPDAAPVPPAAVRGMGRLRVPAAGLPLFWWSTDQRIPLAALGLALTILLMPDRRRPRRVAGTATVRSASTA